MMREKHFLLLCNRYPKTIKNPGQYLYLGNALDIAVLELAGIHKTLDLGGPDSLDLVGDRQTVELASKRGNLIRVNLALDKLDITEDSVNLSGARISARGKVVGVLDGALEHALVLLDGVLGGLLGLLGALAVGLGGDLCLGGSLGLGGLFGLGLVLGGLFSGLALEALLVLGGAGLLAEALDALITGLGIVDKLAETAVVLGLLLLAGVCVFALDVALLVATLAVVRNVLVEVLKGAPAVKVVPKVVKLFDLFLGSVGAAKRGDGVHLGEAALGLEDLAPQLVVVALGELLLAGRLDLGLLVDRVILATLDGFHEDVGGLLDALEELVVLGLTKGGLLVGVVLQDLLAVSLLDLLLGSPPAVLGQAENLVVVLALRYC